MHPDDPSPKSSHAEKLGTILWRTLDRLEQKISDRTIEPAQAREIIHLVEELASAVPGSEIRLASLLDQAGLSRIHSRTQGRSA